MLQNFNALLRIICILVFCNTQRIQMIFCRGLKDPEGAKRRMETKAAAAAEMEGGGGGMKWQVN